jgi:transmembrane sensor
VGEQKKITLTDGSVVQLNTNSQVMINFSAEKRLIQLVKGEALFRVEKDKNRPFTVMVNEQSYTALGTVFALRKSSNAEVTLTVTEGKVLLTDTASVAQIPEHFTELDEFDLPGLVIHPNEQAIAKNGKAQQIDQLPRAVVSQQLAWQHGMLIFNDQPLSSVLTEVERYTQTQFELSPELASIRVGGSYHTGDIDTFLSSLKQNFSLAIIPIGKNKVRISANKFNNHQK